MDLKKKCKSYDSTRTLRAFDPELSAMELRDGPAETEAKTEALVPGRVRLIHRLRYVGER